MAINAMDGSDIRSGITQADDVMHGVRQDLKSLAGDTKWQGLTGKDRLEFFRGMTKDEYDTMKDIAFAMGPKGTAKLESLLHEMVAVKGDEGDDETPTMPPRWPEGGGDAGRGGPNPLEDTNGELNWNGDIMSTSSQNGRGSA